MVCAHHEVQLLEQAVVRSGWLIGVGPWYLNLALAKNRCCHKKKNGQDLFRELGSCSLFFKKPRDHRTQRKINQDTRLWNGGGYLSWYLGAGTAVPKSWL